MLFQSVRAKLPYRSNIEADGFTWQAWGAELGYRSQAAATQWLHGDTYLRSGGEGGSKEKKIPPHHIHGLGVPDWRVVLFICRDNGGYKRTWADLPSLSVHEVRMGVLLRDHKVAFVFAGVCCHTRFRRGDDEGPLQLKPLILSVVCGLQLVGVQLCSAPAQVNRFWVPLL